MPELVAVVGPGLFYGLAALACPLGMGAMMWMMMRGGKAPQPGPMMAPGPSLQEAEMARLQAEIDQLKAERDRPDPIAERERLS